MLDHYFVIGAGRAANWSIIKLRIDCATRRDASSIKRNKLAQVWRTSKNKWVENAVDGVDKAVSELCSGIRRLLVNVFVYAIAIDTILSFH